MKRVFLLLSLMIGLLYGVQANPTFDSCDTPAMAGNTHCNEDCSDCLADEGTFHWQQFGPCYQYGFRLSELPTLGCLGYSFNYVWTINGLPAPGGFSPTSRLINFSANGTYEVCITIEIISNSTQEVCHSYKFCHTVEIDCFPCDLLDCDDVVIKERGTNYVGFTFPLTNCENCLDPYYNISWKKKVDENWNGGGYSIDGGEVVLYFLEPCTEYEIRIELSCDGEEGEIITSCIFDFMTLGCLDGCEVGFDCEEVAVKDVGLTDMAFSFQPILDCPNCPYPYYNIGWRIAPGPWNYGGTTVAPGSGTGTIFSLDPCTTYEFIIELKCPTLSEPYPWQTPTVAFCLGEAFTTDCPFAAPDSPVRPALSAVAIAYPNPATSDVNILVLSDNEVDGVVHIYNGMGVLVKQMNAQTNIPVEVSLENLTAGIYHYTFNSDNNAEIRVSGKLVIVK